MWEYPDRGGRRVSVTSGWISAQRNAVQSSRLQAAGLRHAHTGCPWCRRTNWRCVHGTCMELSREEKIGSAWSKVRLQELTVAHLVKIFPLHRKRRLVTVFTTSLPVSLFWANLIQSTFFHPSSWIGLSSLCRDYLTTVPRSWGYLVLDDYCMNWKGCRKKRSWPMLRYYPGICLEGLRTSKNISVQAITRARF